jgi:hypothetical protein
MIIPTSEPDQQSKPRKGSSRPPNQILNLDPMSKEEVAGKNGANKYRRSEDS